MQTYGPKTHLHLYFHNHLYIFKQRIPTNHWIQLLICEHLLVYFMFCDRELNIVWLWPSETFEDIILAFFSDIFRTYANNYTRVNNLQIQRY